MDRYCRCPKKPGGILEVNNLKEMVHLVCGLVIKTEEGKIPRCKTNGCTVLSDGSHATPGCECSCHREIYTTNIGWLCPACGRGNAPTTSTCPCKPWPKMEVTS